MELERTDVPVISAHRAFPPGFGDERGLHFPPPSRTTPASGTACTGSNRDLRARTRRPRGADST